MSVGPSLLNSRIGSNETHGVTIAAATAGWRSTVGRRGGGAPRGRHSDIQQ